MWMVLIQLHNLPGFLKSRSQKVLRKLSSDGERERSLDGYVTD